MISLVDKITSQFTRFAPSGKRDDGPLANLKTATRWVESLPIGAAGVAPATHLAVGLVVAAAALLATLRPTRRATRINPAITLRAE